MSVEKARSVFCSLCEGDYHLGVASLINSLLAHGFTGTFVIGYRASPPPWLEPLERTAEGYQIQGIRIILEEVHSEWLLAHVKPKFMLDIFERIVPDATSVTYADPDIVIDTAWSFFARWMQEGIAICADSTFAHLPRHHYLRRSWRVHLETKLGLSADDSMETGFNSGFLGVPRDYLPFLRTWHQVIESLEAIAVPLDRLKPGERFEPFWGTDQDALDMATMVHPESIASLGVEGMGFSMGLTPMWHAIETEKPWRNNYLWQLLRYGHPVTVAQKKFWEYASGPIQAFPVNTLRVRIMRMQLATALGRMYHRAQ